MYLILIHVTHPITNSNDIVTVFKTSIFLQNFWKSDNHSLSLYLNIIRSRGYGMVRSRGIFYGRPTVWLGAIIIVISFHWIAIVLVYPIGLLYFKSQLIWICQNRSDQDYLIYKNRGRREHDCPVVGFTNAVVSSSHDKVYSIQLCF